MPDDHRNDFWVGPARTSFLTCRNFPPASQGRTSPKKRTSFSGFFVCVEDAHLWVNRNSYISFHPIRVIAPTTTTFRCYLFVWLSQCLSKCTRGNPGKYAKELYSRLLERFTIFKRLCDEMYVLL